jgi:hypothetical protein
VAKHGKNSSDRAAEIDKLRSQFSGLGDRHSDCHGSQTLSEVHHEYRIAELFAQYARHVCCSDIPAANFAHVNPADATRQVAGWNRAEEISE